MYLKALQPLCNFYSELVCLLPDYHYNKSSGKSKLFFKKN